MNLKFIFSTTNEYDGFKKHKCFNIFGLKLKFKVSNFKKILKSIRNSAPKLIPNLEDYNQFNTKTARKICNLAICAIYKNEPDIKEWIEYHRLIGVERFYLYDNESDDNSKEILKPYIASGIVVYTYVKGRCMQIPVYKDAIYRYKNETKWLAIIDLDEYIVPVSTNNLNDFLKDYENYPAVGINWLMFDCNDYDKRPNKLVIEAYTRADYNFPPNIHIKSIVNPKRVLNIHNPHFCIYKKQQFAVDENFNEITEDFAFNKKIPINKIRINHYHTKSKEDWMRKLNTGYADSNKKRDLSLDHLVFDSYDYDYEIQKYLPKLKEVMSMES